MGKQDVFFIMKLTDEQKNNLYSIAIEEVKKIRFDPDFMNILSSIWNVYEKPSTGDDSRYSILGDEIMKHYVMNDDWPDDRLFISILKIKDDESLFLRFIQELVNYQDNIGFDGVVEKINQILPKDIELKKNTDGLYVFSKRGKVLLQLINDEIKFVKCKAKYVNRMVQIDESTIPDNVTKGSFLLAFNDGWNDYTSYTWFVLYFKQYDESLKKIGNLKIMKKDEKNTDDAMDDSFFFLSNEFCSLGQDVSYYKKMYELFNQNSYVFLRALRDAAVFSDIYEDFKNSAIFKDSLLRANGAEKALREGRFIVNGRKMDDAYAFVFFYKPDYYVDTDDSPVSVSFQFKYKCMPYERVYGLIGENGVGKTTLFKKIIDSLTDESKNDGFDGLRPIFSKVMTISYSPFDSFPTKKENSFIDYLYCGLFESDNVILSKENQNKRLRDNIEKINKRCSIYDPLGKIWANVMQEVFPDSVNKTFYSDDFFDPKLNADSICNKCMEMSSGETIIVFAISDIIANIRKDTLLLFDEPEQHLHPHGIMQLIRAIYTILEIFESYAIIATHSPLVIREMLSKNVYVFNREENNLHVAKIGIESFGEDVAILNDIIFKNRSEDKQYEKYIDKLVEKYGDYNNVVFALQNEHNKLGLNTRLLIQSAIERKKGENA